MTDCLLVNALIIPFHCATHEKSLASNARMQALWPYHTYRPVTWDRYYVNEHHEKHSSVSGGVAAGVTIGIFFIVFLFTFGCRIYSQYADRSQSQTPQTQESGLSESLAEDMWICGVPQGPPPPYEVAIRMPSSPPDASPV